MFRQIDTFRNLHADPNFNFQLNRWLPYLPENELKTVAQEIETFSDWTREMGNLASRAKEEGRTSHWAFYSRAAEFFMQTNDPGKAAAYDSFVTGFRESRTEFEYELTHVPFNEASLPAYIVTPPGQILETVVVHGGFDSFAEELLPQVASLASRGFRVILFEGPGQGQCLNKSGLHMTSDWGKPVGAILDFFKIESCSLYGVSLGGCLAIRAAALEPRIKRVIANDILEDFFGVLASRIGPSKARKLDFLLRHNARGLVNKAMLKAAEGEPTTKWALDHGMHVSGTTCPFDYLKWAKTMTTRDISHLVTQDCLLLAAKDDHLIPLEQLSGQISGLQNARSVTARLLTAEEHAGQHCHVGNQGLVNRLIGDWLLERLGS